MNGNSVKEKDLPVAASLRLPVCLLMYFAHISEACAVSKSWISSKEIEFSRRRIYATNLTHRYRGYQWLLTREGSLVPMPLLVHRC
jgi:hypothetical protein